MPTDRSPKGEKMRFRRTRRAVVAAAVFCALAACADQGQGNAPAPRPAATSPVFTAPAPASVATSTPGVIAPTTSTATGTGEPTGTAPASGAPDSQAVPGGKPVVRVTGTCATGIRITGENFRPEAPLQVLVKFPDGADFPSGQLKGDGRRQSTSAGTLPDMKWPCGANEPQGDYTLTVKEDPDVANGRTSDPVAIPVRR